MLILSAGLMILVIGGLAFCSEHYALDNIKSKTVGDGQHGTARWAAKKEIQRTYTRVRFQPELWRQGKNLPKKQGLILGCEGPKNKVIALVDTDDIHAMMTAASGAGKLRSFCIPTSNTPLHRECHFSVRIPRAICSATMQASQKIAMAIRLRYLICAIQHVQME